MLRPEDVANSRLKCTQAANAINSLVRSHRRLYTLKRINLQAVYLIFAAAMIHLSNAIHPQGSRANSSKWNELDNCCQALCEIGSTFRTSSRALEIVLHFKAELLARRQSSTKRPNQVASLNHGIQHVDKRQNLTGTFPNANIDPNGQRAHQSPTVAWDDLESDLFFWPGTFTWESFNSLHDPTWNSESSIEY